MKAIKGQKEASFRRFSFSPSDYGEAFASSQVEYILGYMGNVMKISSRAGVFYFKECKGCQKS